MTALLWTIACSAAPEIEQGEPVALEEAFAARNAVKIRGELKPDAPIVATLKLGERVEVIARHRRFVRIRTADGAEGWTRDTRLATSELREFIDQLRRQTASSPSQGTFRALYTLNVHLEPYRWSPTIYQLQEDEAAELLRHRLVDRLPSKPEEGKPPPAPTGVDEWDLVRLANGHAGWVLATSLYSAIPDEVKQYAERRRITSYFSLGEVKDERLGETKQTWLWTQLERSKQPYDFDRIRVFLWSPRRQSYQTIKMEGGLTGHLPVLIQPAMETRHGKGTGFTITVEKEGQRLARTYALVNNRVYQIDEKPAPPPPPPIRFVKEKPPPPPQPSLVDRLFSWWQRNT